MVDLARSLHPAAHRARGPESDRGVLTAAAAPARRTRIALDAGCLRLDRAGVARYTVGLAGALARLPDLELVMLGAGGYVEGGLRRRATVLRQDLLWHPWAARRSARASGAAVHHAPMPRAPLRRGRPPSVVTVHDLNFLVRPETASSWNGWLSRRTIRRVLGAADRIIAISHATADDLAHLLGVGAERVRVVPNGVDDLFFRPAPAATGESPYVLFVGTAEPRKNLSRLVAAVEARRARGAPERLLVVGARGWGGVRVERSASVEPLGRLSDEELRRVYAGAACLVLPSLHEGFGLPAVEAMAAGCPVVAARAGALPEVCGDAAVLVDPLDVMDIARGIDQAIADADRLRAAGARRAATMTWDRCATATAAVYRELL